MTEFGFKAPVETQWQRGLGWLRAAPGERVLMAQDATLPECIDRTHAQALGAANRRSWWLLDAEALAHCQFSEVAPATAAGSAGDREQDLNEP